MSFGMIIMFGCVLFNVIIFNCIFLLLIKIVIEVSSSYVIVFINMVVELVN